MKIAERMVLLSAIVLAEAELLLAGDPVSDVFGQDVDHPNRAELRHQMLGDHVGVALAGRDLELMVGQPVWSRRSGGTFAGRDADHRTCPFDEGFGALPRLVGELLGAECSR